MTRTVTCFAISVVIVWIGMRAVPAPTSPAVKSDAVQAAAVQTVSMTSDPPPPRDLARTAADVAKAESSPHQRRDQSESKVALSESHADAGANRTTTGSEPPRQAAPSLTTSAGRQVVIDERAAARIDEWVQTGRCRVSALSDSNSIGEKAAAGSGAARNDGNGNGDGVQIRIEVDSPLGTHLKELVGRSGPTRIAAVLLWFAPGTQIPGPNSEIGTLRLTCDNTGVPQLIASATP